jgi:hypothetical protein
MKHAYLIIAHNEPIILQLLISSLDDVRNDIYVHIDRKASFDTATLHTVKSKLCILPVHIDARWGDYSLVEVELLLFKWAYNEGPYGYYHLLSGVDLPIKSQDYIHRFCDEHQGMEFIGIAQHASQRELDWRTQHWFIYPRDFQSKNIFKKIIRAAFARIQSLMRYRRTSLQVKKGSQWCSVTHNFVEYVLQKENQIFRAFNHTYCPDELFIQTLCWNSDFKKRIFDLNDEFEGCKRYIKWENSILKPLSLHDVDDMVVSLRWFARKFSSENMDVVFETLKRIKR